MASAGQPASHLAHPQRLRPRGARCWMLASALSLIVISAGDQEEHLQVHSVLRAAGADEAQLITAACVPLRAATEWRDSFDSAVKLMMQKTKNSMRSGLADIAQGLLDLLAKLSCGDLAALQRFALQANLLKVLATTGHSLEELKADDDHAPLTALTLAGIDVHTEVNAVLVAWQLRKPAEELGQALAMLLRGFFTGNDEQDDAEGASASSPAPGSAGPVEERRTSAYWTHALNQALYKLGEPGRPVVEGCFTEDLAKKQADLVDTSFKAMMQKSRSGMQLGLKLVADDTLRLLSDLEIACGALRTTPAVVRLKGMASRLRTLAKVKTLINPGVNIDYDPMKALKVGGVDVHLEINHLIGAWINNHGPTAFGEALANFFEDFKAVESDSASNEAPATGRSMRAMLDTAARSAALSAKGGGSIQERPMDLEPQCYSEDTVRRFVEGMTGAIEQMLQKRKRTMQQGLRELAVTVDELLASQPPECIADEGPRVMKLGATKLKKVTSRLAVDYGTHIKYEAMKSLIVGGMPIHVELNNFLAAWKLRSPEDSGASFGQLLSKLSSISGYDEL